MLEYQDARYKILLITRVETRLFDWYRLAKPNQRNLGVLFG